MALLAVVVLPALLVTGCGHPDAGTSPTDASQGDFCAAYAGLLDVSSEPGAVHAAVSALSGVGTPVSMPAAARSGFELTVSTFAQLGRDASQADAVRLFGALSTQDKDDLTAFGAYVVQECPGVVPGA